MLVYIIFIILFIYIFFFFFFFNDTATTEIYTLSLHDALPILLRALRNLAAARESVDHGLAMEAFHVERSEEHTSELQSQFHLVCRLLLEKKKKKKKIHNKSNKQNQIKQQKQYYNLTTNTCSYT